MLKKGFFYCCFIFLAFGFSLLTFAEGGSSNVDPNAPQFFQLDPDLVVNLKTSEGEKSYLQVHIQILVKDSAAIEKFKYHHPLIRDRLITLLSSKTKSQMEAVDERKKVRQEALKVIQDTMTEMTGEPLAKEVLFTQFAVE